MDQVQDDARKVLFCKHNWLIIALTPQPLENILLKMSFGIEHGLQRKDGLCTAHFAQPFVQRTRRRFAHRTPIRRIGK